AWLVAREEVPEGGRVLNVARPPSGSEQSGPALALTALARTERRNHLCSVSLLGGSLSRHRPAAGAFPFLRRLFLGSIISRQLIPFLDPFGGGAAGLIQFALLAEEFGKDVVGAVLIRGQFDVLLVAGDGLIQLALLLQVPAEFTVMPAVIRIELDRPPQNCNGIVGGTKRV